MTTKDNKPLRFAALIRVSTERQEDQGESLREQTKANQRNVELLGGRIVGWYGGQEHATEGYERKELRRLIDDAQKGKFDAVIIAHVQRWDRGSDEAKEALKVFKERRIRFFISVSESNLFDPGDILFLDMMAAFGKFQAANQNKLSTLSRISRAKHNQPSSGRLPFGRTYNKATKEWGIDAKQHTMIRDIAERYLNGERLMDLAREYRVNHSNICRILKHGCGDTWEVEFDVPELDIKETVTLNVPRLLDEATIKRVAERLIANSTYLHGDPKYDYLLQGRVFCAECGYQLGGQPHGNNGEFLYYRHSKADGAKSCPIRPRPLVPAHKLEQLVLGELFGLFGNPAQIERAVRAAIPDCGQARADKERLEGELAKIAKARNRVLDRIEDDDLTDAQAKAKLLDLKEREAALRSRLESIEASLADVPDEEALRLYVSHIEHPFIAFQIVPI
jgi:DNA invertase Pin-like site-specific DNA recombinase